MALPHRLATSSIVLRRFEPVDALALDAALDHDWDHLAPALGALVAEGESAAALIAWMGERFDRGERWHFGIFAPEGELLGGASLEPAGRNAASLGYWLRADRQGRGHATTAAACLTRLGLDALGLAEVHIATTPENHRSGALAARLGFRRLPGTPRWAMSAAAFPSSPAAARSPAAEPDGGWSRLRAQAGQRFALVDERPEAFRILWEFPTERGDRRPQAVEVARVPRHGHSWIEVRAAVVEGARWGAAQALLRARRLTGGLFLEGESLVVRSALPLRGLTFDAFARVLEVVGYEAAQLGVQPAPPRTPQAIFDGLYL